VTTLFLTLRLTPDEWMIPLFDDPQPAGKRDVLEGRLIWLGLEALKRPVPWRRAPRTASSSAAVGLPGAGKTTRARQLAEDGQRWSASWVVRMAGLGRRPVAVARVTLSK
jgi:hypothetical protein